MNRNRVLRKNAFAGLWLSMAMLLLCAAPEPAAGQGNGNSNKQKSTFDVGYAIVTPTSTNKAGLVAFETFGEIRGLDTTQAAVLPSNLSTQSMLFVSLSGRLGRNLGIAIANPGTAAASVTLTLHKEDGTSLASTSLTVAPGHQTAQFVSQLFANNPAVPHDFTGTLIVDSTQPVAIVGLRFRGINFSTLPATRLSAAVDVPVLAGGAGGPGSLILAQFAAGGGWATEIVLVNSGSQPLTVRVDLFKQDGTPLTADLNNSSMSSFTGIVLPPGGVYVLAHKDADGDSDF